MPPAKPLPKKVYPDRPPGMEKTSFRLYTAQEAKVFPRLVVAVKALQKMGKTNFGLSAPRLAQPGTQEGMFHFHADLGLEGVGHKFVDKFPGPIYKGEYVLDVRELEDATEDQIKKAARPIANRFWDDVEVAVKRNVRSMVFDTHSELYEIDRLGEWGKLSMKAHHYTPINARWKRLMKMLAMGKSNAIFLQRLTDEYKDDKPTGGYKPQGYSKLAYEVQMNMLAWRETDGERKFHVSVEDSRHDPDAITIDLEGEQCTFAALGQIMFPDTDEEFWK